MLDGTSAYGNLEQSTTPPGHGSTVPSSSVELWEVIQEAEILTEKYTALLERLREMMNNRSG